MRVIMEKDIKKKHNSVAFKYDSDFRSFQKKKKRTNVYKHQVVETQVVIIEIVVHIIIHLESVRLKLYEIRK